MNKNIKLKKLKFYFLYYLFIIFLFIVLNPINSNALNFNIGGFININGAVNIDFFIFYRTAEVIEITGNEDTFNSLLKTGIYLYLKDEYLNYRFNFKFLIYPQLYSKARFFDFFSHNIFMIRELKLQISTAEFFFTAGYFKNIVLNYNFENFNPPIVYNLPSYPLNYSNYVPANSLPYFPFILGARMLPIYYVNSVWENDISFLLSYITNKKAGLRFSLGISNGEDGLDSNSAKTVIGELVLFNENLLFKVAFAIGNRGSVPIKVFSHVYSLFFEYRSAGKNYSIENFCFEFALEGIFTIHGFTKPYINPYSAESQNFSDDYTLFYNLYQYYYPTTTFFPDDLPNIDKPGEPLFGIGGFLYIGLKFKDFKIYSHFSIYDSNVLSNRIFPYNPRYRVVVGTNFRISKFLRFIIGFLYQYDPVFINFAMFYDAENRNYHLIIDYDLFFSFWFKI